MELKDVQEKFENDCFATKNGAVVEEFADGYAKCSMEITKKHCNALGSVMGGAIFTLADFAFAVAANWNSDPHVTLTSQITYLGRAKGSKLIAEAQRMKEGRNTCYYLITVQDDLGQMVAHVTVNGFHNGAADKKKE